MSAEQRDLELVNGYCSGALTDAEFLELEDRLRESSQLRQLLVEYRSIETALPSALPSDTIQPAESNSAAKDSVIRHLRMEVLAMAAAIMLLVGGIAYLWSRNPTVVQTGDTPHVAVVTQAVGAYDSEDVAIRSGQQVMSGQLSLDRGLVRLDFVSGATIAVEGPAKLEVVNKCEWFYYVELSRQESRIRRLALLWIRTQRTWSILGLRLAFPLETTGQRTCVCSRVRLRLIERDQRRASRHWSAKDRLSVRQSDRQPSTRLSIKSRPLKTRGRSIPVFCKRQVPCVLSRPAPTFIQATMKTMNTSWCFWNVVVSFRNKPFRWIWWIRVNIPRQTMTRSLNCHLGGD